MMAQGLLRFTGAVERDPAIATFFDAQPSELRSLATEWFGRIRRCGADVRELMHDGLATAWPLPCRAATMPEFRATPHPSARTSSCSPHE